METKLLRVKDRIIKTAQNPEFIHHKWFVKWHLQLVEQLVSELCYIYPEADKEICSLLTWLHDYGKILTLKPKNFHKGDALTFAQERLLLEELNFPEATIDKTISYLQWMERKMEEDLSQAPIEVQIISSADAASHLIGPFMSLYWYENPDKPIEEILNGNAKKATKDWERKITLPEVKQRFQERYDYVMECGGKLPDKYF